MNDIQWHRSLNPLYSVPFPQYSAVSRLILRILYSTDVGSLAGSGQCLMADFRYLRIDRGISWKIVRLVELWMVYFHLLDCNSEFLENEENVIVIGS